MQGLNDPIKIDLIQNNFRIHILNMNYYIFKNINKRAKITYFFNRIWTKTYFYGYNIARAYNNKEHNDKARSIKIYI